MKEVTLLNSSESAATGEWVAFRPRTHPKVIVVVTVASAGTVTLQGKLKNDATIVPLKTASTATDSYVAQAFPLMRAISSGVSGGAVRVTVGEMEK